MKLNEKLFTRSSSLNLIPWVKIENPCCHGVSKFKCGNQQMNMAQVNLVWNDRSGSWKLSAAMCREIISCCLIGAKTVDDGMFTEFHRLERGTQGILSASKYLRLSPQKLLVIQLVQRLGMFWSESLGAVFQIEAIYHGSAFYGWRASTTVALSDFPQNNIDLKLLAGVKGELQLTDRLNAQLAKFRCWLPGKSNLDATKTLSIRLPRLYRFSCSIFNPIWKSISIQGSFN